MNDRNSENYKKNLNLAQLWQETTVTRTTPTPLCLTALGYLIFFSFFGGVAVFGLIGVEQDMIQILLFGLILTLKKHEVTVKPILRNMR